MRGSGGVGGSRLLKNGSVDFSKILASLEFNRPFRRKMSLTPFSAARYGRFSNIRICDVEVSRIEK
jgi:hypothetical protein